MVSKVYRFVVHNAHGIAGSARVDADGKGSTFLPNSTPVERDQVKKCAEYWASHPNPTAIEGITSVSGHVLVRGVVPKTR